MGIIVAVWSEENGQDDLDLVFCAGNCKRCNQF